MMEMRLSICHVSESSTDCCRGWVASLTPWMAAKIRRVFSSMQERKVASLGKELNIVEQCMQRARGCVCVLSKTFLSAELRTAL